MSDPAPLDYVSKRRILYAKGQEGARRAKAEEFIGAGRLSEALELLERVEDNDDLLNQVCDRAVENGDAFSLGRAGQLLRTEQDAAKWRALSEKALSIEKYFDAIRALEFAGDQEQADAMHRD
ncbi:MAG: hypothetical protein ACYTG4_05300 [Planctomycetota bacterium]|jgi:hypothetical protein